MLIQLGNEKSMDVTDEVRQIMGKQTQKISMLRLTELVKLFNNAANESRLAWQPSLALELAIAQGVQLFDIQASQSQVSTEIREVEAKSVKRSNTKEESGNPKQVDRVIHETEKSEVEKVFESPAQENIPDPQELMTEGEEHSVQASFGINEVRESLTDVKNLIRNYRKNTEALLASARSFSMKNGVIIIGFQSPVLKERMEKGDHQEIIQRAFSHVLGAEARVKAVVINAKSNLIDHEEEFEPDSLVSAALDLGGKIVDKE
jgi:DNA polymerase-3 subunit gamma/tau